MGCDVPHAAHCCQRFQCLGPSGRSEGLYLSCDGRGVADCVGRPRSWRYWSSQFFSIRTAPRKSWPCNIIRSMLFVSSPQQSRRHSLSDEPAILHWLATIIRHTYGQGSLVESKSIIHKVMQSQQAGTNHHRLLQVSAESAGADLSTNRSFIGLPHDKHRPLMPSDHRNAPAV